MSPKGHSSSHVPRRLALDHVREHHEGNGHVPMNAPVLVLNASYEPINVCAARRAIVLVLKGVAMTEEENGHYLHAARLAMRLPSVIRLLEYRRIPHQTRALSRSSRGATASLIITRLFASGCPVASRMSPRGAGSSASAYCWRVASLTQ